MAATSDKTKVHLSKKSKPQVSTDQSDEVQPRLTFSNNAKRELWKHMTNRHLLDHLKDAGNVMTCHKTSWKLMSTKYRQGVHILTRTKLFAILYLGLLLVRDKIQLGDMLRFIREGHLSYNNVLHFFPDDLDLTCFNQRKWNHSLQFTHASLRRTAAKLAELLEISSFITVSNVTELSRRYCQELNLPGMILAHVYTFRISSSIVHTSHISS